MQTSSNDINSSVCSIQTTLFLVAVLGHQCGAYPSESATWQLLIHFTALADRQLHVQDTGSYESTLCPEALVELGRVARNIKTMQKQNKALFLDEEGRGRGVVVDIERKVKDWARRYPNEESEGQS